MIIDIILIRIDFETTPGRADALPQYKVGT
jgi:hypothetical protein